MTKLVWSDWWNGYVEVDVKENVAEIPEDAKYKYSVPGDGYTTDVYLGYGFKYYGYEWT